MSDVTKVLLFLSKDIHKSVNFLLTSLDLLFHILSLTSLMFNVKDL